MRSRWVTVLGAALLALGAAVLVALGGEATLELKLVALIAVGTSFIALLTGYGVGHFGDRGAQPP